MPLGVGVDVKKILKWKKEMEKAKEELLGKLIEFFKKNPKQAFRLEDIIEEVKIPLFDYLTEEEIKKIVRKANSGILIAEKIERRKLCIDKKGMWNMYVKIKQFGYKEIILARILIDLLKKRVIERLVYKGECLYILSKTKS